MSVTLGTRLKNIRTELGFTQEQMADYLEVSRTTYTHYEKGTRCPNSISICSICKKLNISADYLLGISETKHVPYSNAAELTGLSEYSLEYLEKAKDQGLTPYENDYYQNPHKLHINDILSLLIEDADSFTFLKIPEKPKTVDINNYDFEQKEAVRNNIELRKNNFFESYGFKSEEEVVNFKKQESENKAHLLNTIISYLTFENEKTAIITSKGLEIPKMSSPAMVMFGDTSFIIPSNESSELVEFMLIQKVFEALRKCKELFRKKYPYMDKEIAFEMKQRKK